MPKIKTYDNDLLISLSDRFLGTDSDDNDRAITLYGEVGVPTSLSPDLETAINNVVVFKAGLDFTTKKNWTYGLSYDTEKRIWLKVGKRFDF